MKPEDFITDEELEDVFNGIPLGARNPRDFINRGLKQISEGYAVGYTMEVGLSVIGFINKFNDVTIVGKKYLEVIR